MRRDYIADSERNVVFHVVELAGRLLGRRRSLRLRRFLTHGLTARLPSWLPGTGARAEHLHRIGDDLGAVAVLAFLVLPLPRADAAFDVDLRALLQIFAGNLGEAAEKGDAVPLRGFLHFPARLVLPPVGGGDPDVGDGVAARQVLCFGIGAQVADQNHFVYRRHFHPSPVSSLRTLPSSHCSGTTLRRAMRSRASTSAS